MSLKLGKLPATTDDRDLALARYARRLSTPEAPIGYGHTKLVESPWGMLGNDEWGDCALAGPAHEHMLTSAAGGHQVSFTTSSVLKAYSDVTGFDPNAGPPGNNPTDQGSSVRDVLKYRKTTGLLDSAGGRHRIAAYVALTPGDWTELLQALYLFECVGIGINMPASAMRQFNDAEPWRVVQDSPIDGGHYVAVVARPYSTMVTVITWGKPQLMTSGFYRRYCDEAWAILSPEMLNAGRSLEGFDLHTLHTDLDRLS